VQWSGFLTPTETGDYLLGILADGFARVMVDGKEIVQVFNPAGPQAKLGRLHLEKGQKVAVTVTYGQMNRGKPRAQLLWARVNSAPSPEALAAAKAADVVVAVVGITSELEGEEMPVAEEGFLGGDRTSLDLPKPEEALLEAVAGTGKPLIVVLMNGSALGVNWAKAHANAIVEAWYSGEEGGAAVAETLSGKNNPAGRLPVTFYKDVSQLPNFENYSMEGRTYRYFKGNPLYPFGYGLSYSTFSYSGLTLPTADVAAGDPVTAEVTVTNTGSRAGDEVVELYLTFPDVKGAPLRALRGFKRVHMDAGASQKVQFELKDRDLSMVTETGDPVIAEGPYTITIGGGQPDTGGPVVAGNFRVKGQVTLPE
jgi:beta-glucosidase